MSNFKVKIKNLDTDVRKSGDLVYAAGGIKRRDESITISGGGGGGSASEITNDSSVLGATVKDALDVLSLNDNLISGTLQDSINDIYNYISVVSSESLYNKVQELRAAPADVILTTTGSSDLNNAIQSLQDGEILEVRASAAYSPITIPSGIGFGIKVTEGYFPTITGQECVKISDGASNFIMSGLFIENCTTSYVNGKGSAITFEENHSKASNLIFHNITIRNAEGSAILIAYYNGADYANDPSLDNMSTNISFLDCHLHKATTDKIEGGAICLRGINGGQILNCHIDSANLGRGMHLQNSLNLVVEGCYVNNCDDANGGEGIKLDQLGVPNFTYRNSAIIRNNIVKRCIEGIDLDDMTSCNIVQNNLVSECSDEAISVDGGGNPMQGFAALVGNTCYKSTVGIRLEGGSTAILKKNVCYNNITDYLIQNGYILDDSNTTSLDDTFIGSFTSLIKNDSAVSGTLLVDALDNLDQSKQGVNSGTTRTLAPSIGEMFFDTNLNIPIWYNGTNWVDSSGNIV